MKAKIIEKENKFEPITIELTIESEEELCDLWHRVNTNEIEIISTNDLKHKANGDGCDELYNILNEYVHVLNLRK